MFYITILISLFLGALSLEATSLKKEKEKYITVRLNCQFGNQLFQIATAYAYSLDHDIPFTVPDLVNKTSDGIPHNAEGLFLAKIPSYTPVKKPSLIWKEPVFNYTAIPASSRLELQGYFQSDKYFKHRRNEILELFSIPQKLKEKILTKHPILASEQLIVGIQIRDYQKETHLQPSGAYHPTMGRSYYQKAMAHFPKNTIFFISSNNPSFAKECTKGLGENLIYLNEKDYIEEFYTLTLCKSFIISNSSFGWWAAWLSTAQNKKVIAPNPWFSLPYDNDSMKKDLLPTDYLVIDNTED